MLRRMTSRGTKRLHCSDQWRLICLHCVGPVTSNMYPLLGPVTSDMSPLLGPVTSNTAPLLRPVSLHWLLVTAMHINAMPINTMSYYSTSDSTSGHLSRGSWLGQQHDLPLSRAWRVACRVSWLRAASSRAYLCTERMHNNS